MKKIRLFLGNPFNDARITNLRLVQFAQDASEALKGEFAELAVLINDRVELVLVTLTRVATGRTKGSSDTDAVDAYIKKAHSMMKKHRAHIAVATGGEDSEGFRAFYPDGLSGYGFGELSREKAPLVYKRVTDSLATYGAGLSADIRTALASIETGWTALRAGQKTTLENLDGNRNERDEARLELEWVLIDALHEVGKKYKKEPKKGEGFFKPRLLLPKGRKKAEADVPAGAVPATTAAANA
ncbi:hypothetical protein [Flaviaesturariibacter aridisoli]|uniref:Uncharacterized protein n=1 Tax=Flaviaesturariibacter aridisoli TaxID=2545761 RepID=A0A4R4E769_9BACT|nr:hypothetical protein [Flaviaesturariibacter aridisoli]TCZ74763.1 hypothetical protein E0486_00215 [Flaviaesturariibacter aridisoli]